MDDAEQWGIERAYVDAMGQRQVADAAVVREVIASLAAADIRQRPADESLRASGLRAWQGNDAKRHWLLAAQLYGVRSAANWGHGDFGDLAALLRLASEVGAAGVGLNPLHALFLDRPEEASPYSPNSRLFLNPLYIDVAAAPGFPGINELGLQDELERLRSAELVDYSGVARAKFTALYAAYRRFCRQHEHQDEFAAFRQEQRPTLGRFAAFETLRHKFRTPWWEWPSNWRRPPDDPVAALGDSHADEIGFHEYAQWVADRQLRRCRELAAELGCSVGLYVDLAVGVQAVGADVWSDQDVFLTGLSVGAPPDQLNHNGQDWGLTTFNPHRLTARDFSPYRQLLASTMRHAGAIRIDHILGLSRIFVIPRGSRPRDGVYLRYPLRDMLAVLAEESVRSCCIVIGEDLGTVPEGFRGSLADRGIWTYVVMLFEREHDGSFRSYDRYPVNALATFATHDLATFAGWSMAHDLDVKHAIGLDPGETGDERAQAVSALRNAMAEHRKEDDDLLAVTRCLAQSPSRLVSISVEDVLGLRDQVNVPGTVDEHPNWRRRLPVELERITTEGRLRAIGLTCAEAGRGSLRD